MEGPHQICSLVQELRGTPPRPPPSSHHYHRRLPPRQRSRPSLSPLKYHTDRQTAHSPHPLPVMSAAPQAPSSATKAVTPDTKAAEPAKDVQKPGATLEEDDEFEDFPVEGACLTRSLSLSHLIRGSRSSRGFMPLLMTASRLDPRGSRGAGGQHPPVGGELGR